MPTVFDRSQHCCRPTYLCSLWATWLHA